MPSEHCPHRLWTSTMGKIGHRCRKIAQLVGWIVDQTRGAAAILPWRPVARAQALRRVSNEIVELS